MFLDQMKNPAFWEKVKTEDTYEGFRAALKNTFDKVAMAPITEVPFTVAADFFLSGDRVKGEAIYFKRRQALTASGLLSLIYPEEKKYFERLQDFIFAICNEYSWEIPAHIPNMTEYIPDDIDLFASETGFYLSEIYRVFEDRLDPLIKTRIKMEVERRIIQPFCNYDRNFAWIGFHSNWAAVCGASVAAAFMYLFPERFDEARPRINKAIDNFLLSYRESGYCYEGLSYWEYGFGFFVCYAQMLYDFTGGKENLFDLPKVKAISSFPQKMFLSGDALVSFSDANMNGMINRGLCHYLAAKYPDTVVPVPQQNRNEVDFTGRWGLFVRDLVWFNPAVERIEETFTDYSEDAQWLVYRTPSFGFAAKGGCNWEAHNHNDTGSFIFAVNGKQVLADVGAGEYTRLYFQDPWRYDYFNPSSRSHNVPILFGNYQKTGGKYRANGTVWDGKTFSYDFASAYDIPEVISLKRTLIPDSNGVSLTDEITYAEGVTPKKGDYIERFVFTEQPVVTGNTVTVGGAVITFTGADAPTLSTELVPGHNNVGASWTAHILDFPVTGNAFTLRVEPQKK